MVLSDRDILECMRRGDIKIEPFEEHLVQPASVDLRLGNEFRLFRRLGKPFVDPKTDEFTEYTEVTSVGDGEYIIVHPGEFLLGTTLEYICLSDSYVGRLEGRSSLGRLGIQIHSTAGHIEPGFEGKLVLEISNVGLMPIALYPGMRICQVSFEKLSSPAMYPKNLRKDSKYVGQDGPIGSLIKKEFEGG